MSAAALAALITQILANLPTIVTSARDLMHLINDAYEQLWRAIGDKDVTPEEVKELIDKIVLNSTQIQAIE